jgi:hypothetical protein
MANPMPQQAQAGVPSRWCKVSQNPLRDKQKRKRRGNGCLGAIWIAESGLPPGSSLLSQWGFVPRLVRRSPR